ncbi:hypothetical protein KEM54_004021 [Ascosphaera aggregata]|nr:hypothetical protein KEM54_004021 [Ascosphaera aggregata]
MYSVSSRLQAVFGLFTSVGMIIGLLIALSTSLFPADVKSSVELRSVKVLKGSPTYYSPRREEYAQIKFDLDVDLSSLFNWNTKQVFLYVLVSYPSSLPGSNTTSEAIIWDYIIPAKPSPYSLTTLKEKYFPDEGNNRRTKRPLSAKSRKSKKGGKNQAKQGKLNKEEHGVLILRNQRPKYRLTDITRSLANRENASLSVGWNVQPWIGPLMWNAGSKTAKNVGDKTVFNLGFVTSGDGGAESKKFNFPELPEKKRERERELELELERRKERTVKQASSA